MIINAPAPLLCSSCEFSFPVAFSDDNHEGRSLGPLVFDVGQCPTCRRWLHRHRETAAYSAISSTPLCAESVVRVHRGEAHMTTCDATLNPRGSVFVCLDHPDAAAWSYDPGTDRWTRVR